jgi:hypothetical protein
MYTVDPSGLSAGDVTLPPVVYFQSKFFIKPAFFGGGGAASSVKSMLPVVAMMQTMLRRQRGTENGFRTASDKSQNGKDGSLFVHGDGETGWGISTERM